MPDNDSHGPATPAAQSAAAPELLCIGNVTIDEAVQPDGTRTVSPGGDALFAALAARRHLPRVTWLAPFGPDFPAGLIAQLHDLGLDAAEPSPRDLPTVRNLVTYLRDGSRHWDLVHGEDHFDAMSIHPPLHGPALAIASAPGAGVLVSAMSLNSQTRLTRWLRENTSATVYLDVQEDYLPGHEDEVRSMAAGCDVFLPSEHEAIALAGTAELPRALRVLRDLGPSVVVIKRAEKGCLVLDSSDTVTQVPADVVEAADSTGAGDAFCGAFAAAHLLGASAVDAARAGAAAARITVQAPGLLGLFADRRGTPRTADRR